MITNCIKQRLFWNLLIGALYIFTQPTFNLYFSNYLTHISPMNSLVRRNDSLNSDSLAITLPSLEEVINTDLMYCVQHEEMFKFVNLKNGTHIKQSLNITQDKIWNEFIIMGNVSPSQILRCQSH